MVVVVVVVSFSSLARISGECSIIHSPPAHFCVCFEVEISSRTLIPLFYARISPQWLRELRRLWPSVPLQVECELRFRIGSHTMPGQRHSEPTRTSLGQGCMRV